MPKGVRGFQKGHTTSEETRAKISKALSKHVPIECDYCHKTFTDKSSSIARKKRHFCCRQCYTNYRIDYLLPEEHNSYGSGYSKEERQRRYKARIIWNHYRRDNHIEKQPCEICGDKKVVAHHDDYSKPTEIRWLCSKHHWEWHKNNEAI